MAKIGILFCANGDDMAPHPNKSDKFTMPISFAGSETRKINNAEMSVSILCKKSSSDTNYFATLEHLSVWEDWAKKAGHGSGEYRDIALARLRTCVVDGHTELSLSSLGLTSVPEFPAHIESLDLSNNPLTSLPKLHEGLQTFHAINCKFNTLPNMPASLRYLWVSHTPLTTLPPINSGLLMLRCQNCQLTSVPEMLHSMTSRSYIEKRLILLQQNPFSNDAIKELEIMSQQADKNHVEIIYWDYSDLHDPVFLAVKKMSAQDPSNYADHYADDDEIYNQAGLSKPSAMFNPIPDAYPETPIVEDKFQHGDKVNKRNNGFTAKVKRYINRWPHNYGVDNKLAEAKKKQ